MEIVVKKVMLDLEGIGEKTRRMSARVAIM